MATHLKMHGSFSSKANLSQSDPTKSDYVSGIIRQESLPDKFPYYKEPTFEITFDGNIDGKDLVKINENTSLVKVSDLSIKQEDIYRGVEIKFSNEEITNLSQEELDQYSLFDAFGNGSIDYFIFIITDKDKCDIFPFTFPSNGIYFYMLTGEDNYIKSLSNYVVKPIDTILLPNKIVYEDQVYFRDQVYSKDETNYVSIENSRSFTWDGDVTDRDTFRFNDTPYYKISEEVPLFNDIQSISQIYSDGNDRGFHLFEGTGCYNAGGVIVITNAGSCALKVNNLPSEDAKSFTAPSVGVYAFYNDITGLYLKTIDFNFRNYCITSLYMRSNSGKKFAITVDDSGTISATEVTK